jgi:hypothetical protein
MEKEIVKVYEGQMILPFGVPSIMTATWETDTQYHCEAISILSTMDGKIELKKIYHPIHKDSIRLKTTEERLKLCFEMAYGVLPRLMWDYGYRMSFFNDRMPNPNNVEINLNEVKDSELIILTHIKRNDATLLDWFENEVKSSLLKSFVDLAKNINIQTSEYPSRN